MSEMGLSCEHMHSTKVATNGLPFYLSEMGLEPTQISPYAPETYVSTIPPLRHFVCKNFLLSCQVSAMLYVLSGGVTSRATLSENDTQSFSCGRVPLRHFACKFFDNLLNCCHDFFSYVISAK